MTKTELAKLDLDATKSPRVLIVNIVGLGDTNIDAPPGDSLFDVICLAHCVLSNEAVANDDLRGRITVLAFTRDRIKVSISGT
ncbi:MAG: hypothetical protein WC250_03965 [Candidatus Paceibacterota bacterium]|jgi:hypothetical protein